MNSLDADVLHHFGNKLRIRVCGLYIENNKLLLLKHKVVNDSGIFWAPPGGGMEFGETSAQTLIRELKEETGLTAIKHEFAFVHEFINPPLQAIELFFRIYQMEGTLNMGEDPEMGKGSQIIEGVQYLSCEEINAIPNDQKHHILMGIKDLHELFERSAYSIFNPQGI